MQQLPLITSMPHPHNLCLYLYSLEVLLLSVPRVTQFNEEEALMQALAEQLKDDQLDNGAIEDNSNTYSA